MKTLLSLIASSFLIMTSIGQQYKKMMYNPDVNFYEVCKAAEKYFETHDKTLKGSGWKGYQRWRHSNEKRYAPTGDRNKVEGGFAYNEYKKICKENNVQNKSLHPNGWKELGPNRIDEPTYMGLGRIGKFYVNPNNDQQIYLGSRSGGFWKTNNGGQTWQGGSTDFLPASGISCIAVSPTNSDSILINVRSATEGFDFGVYRSIDGGNTWTQTILNPISLGWGGIASYGSVQDIIYHPTISNLVFVATSEGLYRSDDNLLTYTNVLPNDDISQVAIHLSNPNKVYAYNKYSLSGSYLLISSDAGQTFVQSGFVGDGQGGDISLSYDCPNCIYIGHGHGVSLSKNEGITFSSLWGNNPVIGYGGVYGFAVSDTDTSYLINGVIDLFSSIDGGQNFNQKTVWYNNIGDSDYIHADLRQAQCINGVFYVATDGFLSKSIDNGNTWQIISQGTAIRENYRLGVSHSNYYKTLCGAQDNGSFLDREGVWSVVGGGDGMECLFHPLNEDWFLISVQEGNRKISTDGINTYYIDRDDVNGDYIGGSWNAAIMFDPLDPMVLYDYTTEGFYKSEDFGHTWFFLSNPQFGSSEVMTIANNNSQIIAYEDGSDLKISVDGGLSFTSSYISNTSSGIITDIAFNPNNDSTIVVTSGGYYNDGEKVFITRDLGSTWSNITYNLGSSPLLSVVIDHTNESNIYLGGEIGLYTMPVGGTAWTLYNQNLPNVAIKELEIVEGANTIKAATWGRGLWEYSLLGREDYPAIVKTNISDSPTLELPKEDVSQFVTSSIEYDGTIIESYIKWAINDTELTNKIPMSNTSANEWKSNTSIPNFPEGTKVYFKVFTIGSNQDTTSTFRFMYEVRHNESVNVNNENFKSVEVYPNPTKGLFKIRAKEEILKVEVMDELGRKLNIKIEGLNLEKNIDLSSYTNGIYYVVLTFRNGDKVIEIVKK